MRNRVNLRVAETIRQRAAHVILYELKDPRMGFVTITRVKLAPDFSSCTIFWSVIGEGSERSKTSHALEHARAFIQRRVAEGLRLRVAPDLQFEFDASVAGAIRMGDLLKQLRDERGPPPPAAPGEGGDAASPSGDPGATGPAGAP